VVTSFASLAIVGLLLSLPTSGRHPVAAGSAAITVDGESVEINAGSVDDAERLLRLCRRDVDDE
jgi:hypothetical protein